MVVSNNRHRHCAVQNWPVFYVLSVNCALLIVSLMLERPEYGDDGMNCRWHAFPPEYNAQFVFINGRACFPCTVPLFDCPGCSVWARGGVLAHCCPSPIVPEVERTAQLRRPLPLSEYIKLIGRWNDVLKLHGLDVQLEPGVAFQPCVWKVPSKPRNHVFWPVDAYGSTIIHDRLRERLVANSISGISLARVDLQSIGELEPNGAVPPTVSQDVDSAIDHLSVNGEVSQFGSFYLVFCSDDSRHRIAEQQGVYTHVCRICKRRIPDGDVVSRSSQADAQLVNRAVVPRDWIGDSDICIAPPYSPGLLLSQRAYEIFRECESKNVQYRKIDVID